MQVHLKRDFSHVANEEFPGLSLAGDGGSSGICLALLRFNAPPAVQLRGQVQDFAGLPILTKSMEVVD